MRSPEIVFFTATLVCIVCHLCGWLIKRWWRPEAYRKHFDVYFPIQDTVAAFYGLQILALPYLPGVGNADALFYAVFMTILYRGYFFAEERPAWQTLLFVLPACLTVAAAATLYAAHSPIPHWAQYVVLGVFAIYELFWILTQLRLRRRIKEHNEAEYADAADFPSHFAQRMEWIAPATCAIALIGFLLANPWVRVAQDAVYTAFSLWFLVITLDPYYKYSRELQSSAACRRRLTENRAKEIEQLIIDTVAGERIFTIQHVNIDFLAKRLGVNRTYISEALARGRYGSFYNMINSLRVELADSLIAASPATTLEEVAYQCGYSSSSLFSRTYKHFRGTSPSRKSKL